MKEVIKPKEKEVSSDRARKIFGIIKNRENFQNSVEMSLEFSTHGMTKELLEYERQTDLVRDKAILQNRHMTRLL